MADPDLYSEGMDLLEEETGGDQKPGRSKRWLLLLLLLLLLLCGITSIVDTWVIRNPDRARFVTRNLECLQCHTELIPDMSRQAVHSPFLLKECTVCHTPHGSEVERTTFAGGSRTWERVRTLIEWLPLKWVFQAYDGVAGTTATDEGGEVVSTETQQVKGAKSNLVAPADELCWICHGNLGPERSMPYPHNPFEKGDCTLCHDPHASDFRVLLVQDERDLCVTCHPMPELSREQVHPPVAERWCTNCHDPHASDWTGILVDNQRDLCFRCHPSVAPLSLLAVQHNPFQYDWCTGCHEPHGSDYRPLLIKDQPPLCYDCHPDIRLDFLKPSHHPVDTVKLDCVGCHDPHATNYDALLIAKDNKLCYVCHAAAIQATYDPSAHGTGDILCINCHTPHGSDYAPILQDRNPWLCYRCHPTTKNANEAYPANHPHRPDLHYDDYAKMPMTCTTTCHDPHGSPYIHMIRLPYATVGYGQDNLCLACHPRVGVDF